MKRLKKVVHGMKQIATVSVQSAMRQVKYIAVRYEWFTENNGKEIQKIYNCIITATRNGCRKIDYLGCAIGYDNKELEKYKVVR